VFDEGTCCLYEESPTTCRPLRPHYSAELPLCLGYGALGNVSHELTLHICLRAVSLPFSGQEPESDAVPSEQPGEGPSTHRSTDAAVPVTAGAAELKDSKGSLAAGTAREAVLSESVAQRDTIAAS